MPKTDQKKKKYSSSSSLSGSRDSSTDHSDSLSVNISAKASVGQELVEDSAIVGLNQSFLNLYTEVEKIEGINKFFDLNQVWDEYSKLKIEELYYNNLLELYEKLQKMRGFYTIKTELDEVPQPKEKGGVDNLSRYTFFKSKDQGREVGVMVSKKHKPDRQYMLKEYDDYFEALNEVLASASMRALLGDVIPKNKIIRSRDGRVLLFSKMLDGFVTLNDFYPSSMEQKEALIRAKKDIIGFIQLKAVHMVFSNLDDHLSNDGFILTDDGEKVAASVDFGRALAFRYNKYLMDIYSHLSEKYGDAQVISPIDILKIKIGSHYNQPHELYLNKQYIFELRRVADCYANNPEKFYAAIEYAFKNIEQNISKDDLKDYALFIGDSPDLRISLKQALDTRVIQLRELADNLELECAIQRLDEELWHIFKYDPASLTRSFTWLGENFEGSVLDFSLQNLQSYLDGELRTKDALQCLQIVLLQPVEILKLEFVSSDPYESKECRKKLINLLYIAFSKENSEQQEMHDKLIEELNQDIFKTYQEIKSFFVPQKDRGGRLVAVNKEGLKSILEKLDSVLQLDPKDKKTAMLSILDLSLELSIDSNQRGSRWIEGSIQSFINFLGSSSPKARSENVKKWRESVGLTDDRLKLLSNKTERSR